MKKLPVLTLLGLLSFQSFSLARTSASTTFNCLEELPTSFQVFMRTPFIITGTIEAVGGGGVKLRVYGIVTKPQGYLLVPSDLVNVTSRDQEGFKLGSKIILFANSGDQKSQGALEEIEHQNAGSDLEVATSKVSRQYNLINKSIKEARFCKLLKGSDAVVFGKVACIGESGSMAYNQHLAHWNKATVFVTESLKGLDAGKMIQVQFPVSLSPVWKDWPTFTTGEETALILKRVKGENSFIAETQSSKISLDTFNGLKDIATTQYLKTLSDNEAVVDEEQCKDNPRHHESDELSDDMGVPGGVRPPNAVKPVTVSPPPAIKSGHLN